MRTIWVDRKGKFLISRKILKYLNIIIDEESPSYETEPEYDEEPEDAPLENEMANDWSDLNQQAEHEEEVEAEDEPKWEKAKKDPKAIYSYVGKGGSRRVSNNNFH